MGGQDATPSQCVPADYRRAGCRSFYISNNFKWKWTIKFLCCVKVLLVRCLDKNVSSCFIES